MRLLNQRFGPLRPEVKRRISAIESAEELTRVAEKVYRVESLAELGLS